MNISDYTFTAADDMGLLFLLHLLNGSGYLIHDGDITPEQYMQRFGHSHRYLNAYGRSTSGSDCNIRHRTILRYPESIEKIIEVVQHQTQTHDAT